jgi:hypothetical protein
VFFGGQRRHQAALAERRQVQRLVEVAVGHHRADRAEGFDVVHGGVDRRVAAQEQRRREEGAAGAALAHRLEAVMGAEDHFVAAREHLDAFAHVAVLVHRGQRAHAHAIDGRVADDDLRQALAQALAECVNVLLGHDDAADRRALLAGLAGHLARDFLHEQVEFRVVRRDVRRQDRAIERIGFGSERHRLADQVRVGAQFGGGVGRTGEGHGIETGQAVQQVAGRADDELQRAFGQQARFNHHLDDGMGQVAGRGGRLADAGHGGEEAWREFFEQAPDREVEGVDVHRQAAAWHQDVGAGEAAALAEGDGRAFVQHVRRRQLAPAHAGVGEQRADAAFDVDPAVLARGAGQVRNLVQLFLAVHQVEGQGFQALGAGLEVELHQAGDPQLAGMGDGFVEVDLFGVGVIDQLAVERAVQRGVGFLAYPAAGDPALQGVCHVLSPQDVCAGGLRIPQPRGVGTPPYG